MSETKSLNQKFEELEKAKEWFYSDDFSLDKAAEKYKMAINLAKELQEDLSNLQNEIEILDEDFTK
jgi:exonuclease VII small subunit